jgi:hypothetical protein
MARSLLATVAMATRMVGLAIVTVLAGCFTDPLDDRDELGELLQYKATYKDFPVAPGPGLSIASACIEVPLVDTDETVAGLQPDCSFSILFETGGERIMPSCSHFPDVRPCWRLIENLQDCHEAQHLEVEIVRAAPATYPHHVVLWCVSR